MCQKLVDRVAQSKQLMAVADPELLVLFEDWLDELENEVILLFKEHGPVSPEDLAHKLGLSRAGSDFSHFEVATGRKVVLSAWRLAMQRTGTTLLALTAVVLTLGALWYIHRPVITQRSYLGGGQGRGPKRRLPPD